MNEDLRRFSHELASCSSHGFPGNIKLEQGNAISKEWTIEKSDATSWPSGEKTTVLTI